MLIPPARTNDSMTNSDIESATDLKVRGNKAFAQHDWLGAIDFYTQAIEKNGKDPSFYCNRAQVSGASDERRTDH